MAPASRAAYELSGSDGRGAGRTGRTCLLYTSDAADERSSVDLGGRRILKKNKKIKKKTHERCDAAGSGME